MSRRWREVVTAARMDVTPLRRYRDYRLLMASGLVSMFGSYVTMIAAPLQIKQLTDSYVAVGLIGAAEFVPMIMCGLWGGAIADALDRRTVVLITECAQLIFSAALMANALLAHPQVWVIYVASAAAAAATSIQRPSMDAMMPRLVGHEHLAAASALNGLQYNGAAVLAPALGGVLAAATLSGAYAVDVASFVLSLVLLGRIAPVPPGGRAERSG